jgi:hypothetical protein
VQAEWGCPEWTWKNPQRVCKARTSDQNMRHFNEVYIPSYQNEMDRSISLESEEVTPGNRMSGKENWGILLKVQPIVVKYSYCYVILMFPWLQSLLLVHMYILLSLSFYVFMKHRTVTVPYIMQMKI